MHSANSKHAAAQNRGASCHGKQGLYCNVIGQALTGVINLLLPDHQLAMATLTRRVVHTYREPLSDEERSEVASEASWSQVSSTSNRRFSSLPTHDGQGLFDASDLEDANDARLATSLYPSLQETSEDGFSSQLDDRISWPSSMSATSSSGPRSPLMVPPPHLEDHTPQQRPSLLTSSALSQAVSEFREEDEAALTSSDEEEAKPDPPLALSAGISPVQSRRSRSRRVPIAPPDDVKGKGKKSVKRRHRQSGLSDRGSKRSNTSSSNISLAAAMPRRPLQERRMSLQQVTGSKELSTWRQFRSISKEQVEEWSAQHPSCVSRHLPVRSLMKKPHRLKVHQPLDKFREFVQSELGDLSHLSTALRMQADELSEGEETETDHPLVRRSPRRPYRELEDENFNADREPLPFHGVGLVSCLLLQADFGTVA
jgi:hypothetical protein